ncbi:MAG: M67 family metallopeptidase [Proteobacteria bacterium]|nr:M67 family metallopeptidase [Pseudomonadota bacterium]
MKILNHIYEQILSHALNELPLECCGYLAGKNNRVTKAYPVKNLDKTHDHFSFDVKEQFAAVVDMRNKGLNPVAVYHSHPETPARPSKEDIRLAYDPDISYLIISLVNRQAPDIKSFKIRNSRVKEEEIIII